MNIILMCPSSFFPEIAFYEFLPSYGLSHSGDQVIQGINCLAQLIRPLLPKVRFAEIGRIVGDMIHASDSEESAQVEISRFFKSEEIC